MAALLTASPVRLLILTLCALLLIAAGVIAAIVLAKVLRIRHIKVAGTEIDSEENADDSIILHLETRDFRHILARGFGAIKDDIRNRVRKNGWCARRDWPGYVNNAIIGHDTTLTRIIDEHYYPKARLERIELYEWNKFIWPDIQGHYQALYERLLEIVKDGYAKINIKKAELDNLQENKKCEPESSICPSLYKVIKLTTEILIDENLSIREACMIETERALKEMEWMYYSHYLRKYKETIGG